jgi:hypothetical protein
VNNEEIYNMYSSPSIIRLTKLADEIGRANDTHRNERRTCRIFLAKARRKLSTKKTNTLVNGY